MRSRAGGAKEIPFQQTVVLRQQLLGRDPGSLRTTSQREPGPGRVSWAPALSYAHTLAQGAPVEIFFETLLVLVCVGVLAFAYLTVKKLYQGQR
ncbi:hypothetical protein ACQPXS_22975 [Streptomyces sp. CA-142005]|uniref:hypothetical protein n=1 Tax=Streptomyces sp. CA-142005 TaxID=3240052 RepID=UPI003D8F18B0